MSEQEQLKDISSDENKLHVQDKKLGFFARFKLKIKVLLKQFIVKLQSKIKAYLAKMKKLFMEEEQQKKQKKVNKPNTSAEHRHIPTVLKNIAELENKVDMYLQTHHEGLKETSHVDFAVIERAKNEEHKKHLISSHHEEHHHHLEKKSPLERISSHSIDIIANEILKNEKVKSFIERELSRSGGGSTLRALA